MVPGFSSRFHFAAGAALLTGLFSSGTAQGQVQAPRLQRPVALSQAQAEVAPPDDAAFQARPSAVILKRGRTSAALGALPVKRRIPLPALRAQPVIPLQTGQADMRPVLTNPAALPNIATALRARPALAQVKADSLEAIEVEQGLVVRQFIAYSVKPGVCSNAAKRSQLMATGVSCFDKLTAPSRAAAFANPQDPHYVADPAQRRAALAEAEKAARADDAQVAADLATFRAMMRDPSQRAAIEADIGAAEAARLAALGDEALAGEMVNAADIEVEDVMFVPGVEQPGRLMKLRPELFQPNAAPLGRVAPSSAPAINRVRMPEAIRVVNADHPIEDHIYLTGFTLGREYEWRKRVSVTIKWCLLGCKKTYYAEVYAGFDYGFGLRFPVRMGGTYKFSATGTKESATFTPQFVTLNGSASDYAAAGLASSKIFSGKELVAQVGAYAGLNYKVPVFGSNGVRLDVDIDLTDGLPSPYRDGQFTPPMPGKPSPSANKIFENIDLIGGRANFGFVGAKVMPAIKFDLSSDKLQFQLTDKVTGKRVTMARAGQAYPLAVAAQSHSSNFTIGDPVYGLSFAMTPGIVGRLFVDVKLWSHHWDWPVWFPQLTIKLPPNNATFTCHAGTVCTRDYEFSQKVANESEGERQDPVERVVSAWARDFDRDWKEQCPDETLKLCRTAIGSLATVYRNRMIDEMHKTSGMTAQNALFASLKREANGKANNVVREARQRAAQRLKN